MPRIPVYEQQVRAQGLPGVRVRADYSPQDFGAGLAGALDKATDVARGINDQAREEQRSARLMDAYSRLGRERAELETVVKGAQGSTALEQDLPGLATTRLNEAADKIEKELPEDVRLAFRKVRLQEADALDREARQHYERESEVFAEGAYQGAVKTATSQAVNAYGDPVVRGQAIGTGEQAIEQRAMVRGWAPERRAAEQLAFRTEAHLGVLDRLTDDANPQPAAAKAYLDAHRHEIDGVALGRSNIEKVIAASGVKDRARQEADRIWAEAKGDPGKAVALARGISDTALFDDVDARIKRRVAEDRAMAAAADAPREGRLETGMYQRRTFSRASKDFVQLSPEAQARVEAKWATVQRSARAEDLEQRRDDAAARREAVEIRRQQTEYDRVAIETVKAMDPGQAVTVQAEKFGIDTEGQRAPSALAVQQIKSVQLQKKAEIEKAAKGLEVTETEFLDRVRGVAVSLGYDAKKTTRFAAVLRDDYQRWKDGKSGQAPRAEDVNGLLADAILFGDAKGGSMFSSDQYAWQARAKGEGFLAFAEEEQTARVRGVLKTLRGAKPAPAAAPAAPAPVAKTITRTDPATGETRTWNGSAWVRG